MNTEAIVALAIVATCTAGVAAGGQHLWRRGHRKAVLVCAVGLALLAATLWQIGRGMTGFLAGLGHMVVALLILAVPVAGLLIGAVVGWLRGPAPRAGEPDR